MKLKGIISTAAKITFTRLFCSVDFADCDATFQVYTNVQFNGSMGVLKRIKIPV